MNMPTVPERRVPCPTCWRPSLYTAANPYRPFCSERCRSVDLGAWANEQFRLPAEAPPDPGEEAGGPPAHH